MLLKKLYGIDLPYLKKELVNDLDHSFQGHQGQGPGPRDPEHHHSRPQRLLQGLQVPQAPFMVMGQENDKTCLTDDFPSPALPQVELWSLETANPSNSDCSSNN